MEKFIKKAIMILAIVFCMSSLVLKIPSVRGAEKTPDWASWQFLVGDWVGEGEGSKTGQGTGTFSFCFDLEKNILVRKNHTEYPATKDKPAVSHDDLMIIYQEQGKPAHAIYFDNEGHVINYMAEVSKDQTSLTFISDIAPSAPRFRLTYIKEEDNKVKIRFEIAPPGKPEEFSLYLEGVAHKK